MAKPHKNHSDKELSAESMEDINSISAADFAGITSLSATSDQIASLRNSRSNGQAGAAQWDGSLPPLRNSLNSMSIDPISIAPLDDMEGAPSYSGNASSAPRATRTVDISLPPEILMAEQQFSSARNGGTASSMGMNQGGFGVPGMQGSGMPGSSMAQNNMQGSAMGSHNMAPQGIPGMNQPAPDMGGMMQGNMPGAAMPGTMAGGAVPGTMPGGAMPGGAMPGGMQSMGMPAQGMHDGTMNGQPDFFGSATADGAGLPPFVRQSMAGSDMGTQGTWGPQGAPDQSALMHQQGMAPGAQLPGGLPPFASMGAHGKPMAADQGMPGMMTQQGQNMHGLVPDHNMYQGMAPGAMGHGSMGHGGAVSQGSIGHDNSMLPPSVMSPEMVSAVQSALSGVQSMASFPPPPPAVPPLHTPGQVSHSGPSMGSQNNGMHGQVMPGQAMHGQSMPQGMDPSFAQSNGFGAAPGFNQVPGAGVQPSSFGDPFSDPAFIAAQSIRPAFYGDEQDRRDGPGSRSGRDSSSDDAPAYITPGVKAAARRNSRSESDSAEEGRIIPSPYICDRDEIERRTREIYGNDNDQPAAPVSSDDGEVHTNIFVSEPGKKAPIIPSFMARQMRQREQMQAMQGGAAGTASSAASAASSVPPSTEHTNIIEHTGPAVPADSDYPLLNPKAPSTLINGFAYDFKGKSQDEVRSGLDEIISATPPLPADHVRQNGGSILAADMAQGSQYDRALRAYRDKSQVSTVIMGNQPARPAPGTMGSSGNITTVISHGTVTPPPGTLSAMPLQHKSTTPLTALMSSGAKQSKTILSDAGGRVLTDNYGRITRKISHDNTETNHSVRISAIDFSFKSRPGSDRSQENQNNAAGSGSATTPAAGSINFSDLPSAQPKMTSHEDQDDIVIGSLGGTTSVDLSAFGSDTTGLSAAGSGSASDAQKALDLLKTIDLSLADKDNDASAGAAGAAAAGTAAAQDNDGARAAQSQDGDSASFKLVDSDGASTSSHMPYSSLFDSPDAFGGNGRPRRSRPEFFAAEEPEIVRINPLEETHKSTARTDSISGDIDLPELADRRSLKSLDGMTELEDLGKALRNIADSLNSHTQSRMNFNPLSSPFSTDSAGASGKAGKDILSAPAGSEILGSISADDSSSAPLKDLDAAATSAAAVPAESAAADNAAETPAAASAQTAPAAADAAPAEATQPVLAAAAPAAAPALTPAAAPSAAAAAPAGAAPSAAAAALMGGAPVDPKDAFSNLMARADAVFGSTMGSPAPVSAMQPQTVQAAQPGAVAQAAPAAPAAAAAAEAAAAPALNGPWASYLLRCHSMLGQCTWLAQSGMSYAVFERHNAGFDPFCTVQDPAVPGAPAQTWQALTIPLGDEGYVVYNSTMIFGCTNGEPERRYMGTPGCFNIELLSSGTTADTPLFICSNELDAMALETMGCKAMALGLPYQVMTVLTTLQQLSARTDMRSVLRGPVYICIPADNQTWSPAHTALVSAFTALGVTAQSLDLRSGCPTINQCLIFNRAQFAATTAQILNLVRQSAQINAAVQPAGAGAAASPAAAASGAAAPAMPAAPAAVAAAAAPAATLTAAQAASQGLIMSLENLARMELIPALYTLSCDSEDLSNLVLASLFENRFSPVMYAGNMQQWQSLSSILSSSHDLVRTAAADPSFQVNGYRARFVELPDNTDAGTAAGLIISALSHAQAAGSSAPLLIDTGDLDNETAAALAPVLARLAREFNIPVMAWCSPEQNSCFKGLTHQSITMEQSSPAQITFTAHDSTGAVHTFSAGS